MGGMHTSLHCASSCRNPGLEPIEASVERHSATLIRLRYAVVGTVLEVAVPPPASPVRADRLWESTCFEAFLRAEGEEPYLELNFSPSGEWAAYTFSGYRAGMAEAPLLAPPEICTTCSADRLEVEVTVSLSLNPGAHAMNLAAVIRSRGSERSFWSARHPAGEPDFHDPGCFIHRLPAAPAP
jgi:hypothetical protein